VRRHPPPRRHADSERAFCQRLTEKVQGAARSSDASTTSLPTWVISDTR
jgi:hypothetical protein